MSRSRPGPGEGLRAIAFGSPDGSAWGAALSDGDGWSLVTGGMGTPATPAGALRVSEGADGDWRLEREAGGEDEGLTLLAVPDVPPEPAPAVDGEGDLSAVPLPGAAFVAGEGPELCRVTGTASGRPVDWPGVRVRMDVPASAKEAPASARFVAGWFADGAAVGLIAARPRRGDRPDGDAVSATLFDPDRWLAVSDARLSTTYDGSGTPTRVSLELWIGEGEHEYPRRAAGEASGAPSATAVAAPETGEGPAVQVTPLRCHSRGEEGAGVYVLATF
jgi:hypothetical protein